MGKQFSSEYIITDYEPSLLPTIEEEGNEFSS